MLNCSGIPIYDSEIISWSVSPLLLDKLYSWLITLPVQILRALPRPSEHVSVVSRRIAFDI